jgi:hypothetical protein
MELIRNLLTACAQMLEVQAVVILQLKHVTKLVLHIVLLWQIAKVANVV